MNNNLILLFLMTSYENHILAGKQSFCNNGTHQLVNTLSLHLVSINLAWHTVIWILERSSYVDKYLLLYNDCLIL